MSAAKNESNWLFAEDSQSILERALTAEYLLGQGYLMSDLKDLPPQLAKSLMREARRFAALRLAEIESGAKFRRKIRLPISFEMNPSAPLFLLTGFLALYVTNRFLNAYICHEYECPDYTLGIIPMLGVGLHSFLDGVIYSVTFNVSIFTGVLAAIGMVLHEFPEGIVTFLLLKRGGFNQRNSARYAFLAAAISTPLGTLASYPFIEKIERPILGVLLAFSAGALVYVGASHLLPAVERENKAYSLLSMGAGILVAIVIVLSKG
ncbi:MAG: ZIP family metal transporter [Anaerolineales bacterium]